MATTNGKTATPESPTSQIGLTPLDLRTVEVDIVGESELIMHRWSEKARRLMLEGQQAGKARARKESKVPEVDYEESQYRLPDGSLGFPSAAFKAAIISGCRMYEGITMTAMKTAIRVLGEGPEQLVRIDGNPHMREDMVRLQTGVADIRYRAGVWPWKATLSIRYAETLISLESLIHLVNAGGMAGVGEWRPSAPKSMTGGYGTFAVAGEAGS